MKKLFFFLISIQLCTESIGQAQTEFSHVSDLLVMEEGRELTHPFSGGLNSGQYGTIDLNLDGDLDLVVFDRSSDKLLTFINTGSAYVYSPEFEYRFPEQIRNWIVFADFNCDDKIDIFTYTNLGIRVFKNVSGTQLEWEEEEDPIFTQGTSSQVNLAVNSTDIPAIADLDGDGDLDILVYNFSVGGYIQFHQNMSVENNGNCNSLEYVRVTQEYGGFKECSCDEFVFDGQGCIDGGRVLHAGGKSILAFDRDGDGDMELVIGQEECSDVSILENKGTVNTPIFDSFSNLFPETSGSIDLISFPTPYYEDVNFDGLKDIIVAPNLRSNPEGLIDNTNTSWLFLNTGTDTNSTFEFERKDFLQQDMIDVGEFSYPAFLDIDGDLDDDLVIGNRGTWNAGNYASTLTLYTKTPEGLVLTDEDYWSLSQLNYTFINPSFNDLNGDGKLDLVFSAIDDNDDAGLFYILNSSSSNVPNYQPNQVVAISSSIRVFDDAELFDVSLDGTLDLLLAKSNGKLEYYINTGSNLAPNYSLEDDTYLDLDFSGTNSNLNVTIADINNDGLQDLITSDRSGIMQVYPDFVNEASEPISNILKFENAIDKLPTNLGRIANPAAGLINGQAVIAFGNIRGGLTLLRSTDGGGNTDQLKLAVFPNPSKIDKVVKFNTPNEGALLEIFGVSGNRLVGPVAISANQTLPLDLTTYNSGLYFARVRKNKSTRTVKFILR